MAQMIQEFKDRNAWQSNQIWNDVLNSKKEKIKELEQEIQEKRNQENKMDIMKNFNFGPCGDRAKISHLGIAIKNANGEWVSYDKENKEIVNVDLINFGGDNFVYMIPVALKDVAFGDAIIHNRHIMFVSKVKEDGITVVDVTDGEYKKILPTKSIFGFDFVTKVVSLIDFSATSASEDNPFGNMLPFMLLAGDSKENDIFPLALMMSNMNGAQNLSLQSPLMMALLLNSKNTSTTSEILPLMMMMTMNQEKGN